MYLPPQPKVGYNPKERTVLQRRNEREEGTSASIGSRWLRRRGERSEAKKNLWQIVLAAAAAACHLVPLEYRYTFIDIYIQRRSPLAWPERQNKKLTSVSAFLFLSSSFFGIILCTVSTKIFLCSEYLFFYLCLFSVRQACFAFKVFNFDGNFCSEREREMLSPRQVGKRNFDHKADKIN